MIHFWDFWIILILDMRSLFLYMILVFLKVTVATWNVSLSKAL